MSSSVPSLISRFTVFFAVVFTGVAWVVGGAPVALGAALGGGLSVANWAFVRWVGSRVVGQRVQSRSALSILLSFKLGIAGAILYGLIVRFGIHPGGLALGLGSLVAAITIGCVSAPVVSAPSVSEET